MISQAIVSPYERLAWCLFSGGKASTNELKFAQALGQSVGADVLARGAQAIFERCTIQLVADSAFWVVPVIPGIPLVGHPARTHLDLVAGNSEDVCAAETGLFVLARDGRRPAQFRINPLPYEPNKEFLRSAVLISSRERHRPRSDEAIPEMVRRAIEYLARGDNAPITDVTLRTPPRDALDDLSDSLFGAAWDLAHAVCTKEATAVAPGLYDRPHFDSRLLRSRLAVLQQIALTFAAPMACEPLRLRLLVLEWTRVDAAGAHGNAVGAAAAIVDAHALWVRQFGQRLTDVLIGEGVLANSHSKAFNRALAGEQVLLSGRKVLAKRVAAMGFGLAALRIELSAQDYEDRVRLMRRLWGARLFGKLSISKAAAVVGISPRRAHGLLKSYPTQPVPEVVFSALAQHLELPPLTSDDWVERWTRGEISITSFDKVDSLYPTSI